MIRRSLAPTVRAARTKSRSRRLSTSPRTRRAKAAHMKTVRTMITLRRLGPVEGGEQDGEEDSGEG